LSVENYVKKIGYWFQAKKKSIAIHGTIIAIFIVFLLTFASPLFERLQVIKGAANLSDVKLPIETNNIKYYLERIDNRTEIIEIEGWAFLEHQNTDDSRIYVVLKSKAHIYVFDTIPRKRIDIVKGFSDLSLNLDYSGFMANIPAGKISNGEYIIGIYIGNEDTNALQYTDEVITKTKSNIKIGKRYSSEVTQVKLPAETDDLRYGIDVIKTDGQISVEVQGWAFVDGRDSAGSEIYLVLKSAEATYVFDSVPQIREDITRGYKELNLELDNTGYKTIIPLEKISNGEYTIGILVKNGDIDVLQYTNKTLMKSEGSTEIRDIIPGEAKLCVVELPAETDDLRYGIDVIKTDGQISVEVQGWAFVDGRDSAGSEIYLVLKSTEATYVFDSVPQIREDITRGYKELNLELDNTGYKTIIPLEKISNGEYTIGILVKNGENIALHYTDKIIIKSASMTMIK
jgi:hypothetical protein